MNKNNTFRMRKPIAAALFAIGAAVFCIALFSGAQQHPIAGWTPVNESLKQAIDALTSEDEGNASFLSTPLTPSALPTQPPTQSSRPASPDYGAETSAAAAGVGSSSDAPGSPPGLSAESPDASPAPPAEPVKDAEEDSPAVAAGTLDLNKATEADLDALPGIGPSKAKAIVAHRDKIGGFRRVDQLLDVKGIGPKVFERLSGLVHVAARK
ncbi:helix-hairpin-helix domain-containing protein [Cohnella sp.]|uniref:ComEA family DNA-binding protein n=1 Tax=Cohnella sp. TaxID=1883426 RepID=UPI0035622BD9